MFKCNQDIYIGNDMHVPCTKTRHKHAQHIHAQHEQHPTSCFYPKITEQVDLFL